MRVSKKFQAVVCHILRLRLIQAPQRLAELKPLLECGQPSTMPLNFYCTYRETEGLEKNAAEDWRLMEAYTVFVPQPKQAVANSKESCMGKPKRGKLVSLSTIESFGQFTVTLKLPWMSGQLMSSLHNVICGKTVRLQRRWLEASRSATFWLDDAENVGVHLHAHELRNRDLDEVGDMDENYWEVDVKGEMNVRLSNRSW
ncbi:hypothetical protein POX_e07169 [Penicillium oxalicum]|uniref:hypothetical protein n=1 Tax=Penicillium oxalicum TaxID=69781 RepID=UPI0020B68015|nr:hypothetical protein POX_e07169 [Penicillium oxalicum]KAI2789141.1 hypothetical protein POX_e07169 [Penicillium oxalicum]